MHLKAAVHQEDDILVSAFSYLFTGFHVSGDLEILKPRNVYNGVHYWVFRVKKNKVSKIMKKIEKINHKEREWFIPL